MLLARARSSCWGSWLLVCSPIAAAKAHGGLQAGGAQVHSSEPVVASAESTWAGVLLLRSCRSPAGCQPRFRALMGQEGHRCLISRPCAARDLGRLPVGPGPRRGGGWGRMQGGTEARLARLACDPSVLGAAEPSADRPPTLPPLAGGS